MFEVKIHEDKYQLLDPQDESALFIGEVLEPIEDKRVFLNSLKLQCIQRKDAIISTNPERLQIVKNKCICGALQSPDRSQIYQVNSLSFYNKGYVLKYVWGKPKEGMLSAADGHKKDRA